MKKLTLMAILACILTAVAVAQAGSFTPIANVGGAVAAYTDATPVDGATYTYIITTVAPACPAVPVCGGESVFTAQAIAVIPPTGTHTVGLTWTPASGAASQNVYRFVTPPPASGLKATVN